MGRFLKLKGLNPSDFVDPEKLGKARTAADQYNFMAPPDILPQDEPRFYEIVSSYLNEADKLASQYQKDKTRDLSQDIVGIRSRLQSEIMGGEIAAMKKRKQDNDLIFANIKKAKSPQEFEEARQNIVVEPLNYSGPDSYGRVYVRDHYSQADEKWADNMMMSFATKIKPDQIVLDFLQDEDFVKSYNKDVYTADKVKEITKQKIETPLVDYVLASEPYSRYITINPDDPLIDEEGKINYNSKFGKKIKAYAEAFATRNQDKIVKVLADPEFEKKMVKLRAAAPQQEKNVFVPTSVDNLFGRIGEPRKLIPAQEGVPDWKNDDIVNTPSKIVYDEDQVNEIINWTRTFGDVENAFKVNAGRARLYKLPHTNYISVLLKSGARLHFNLEDPNLIRKLKEEFSNLNVGSSQAAADQTKIKNEGDE